MASFPVDNAPLDFDMDLFREVSDSYGGLAKICRFAVMITPPRGFARSQTYNNIFSNSVAQDLTYLCEAAEFPGRGFENLEVRTYGPTFKVPHRSEYEPINITFICRNESFEREFFDDWMDLINPVSTFNFTFRDEYATNLRLFQYNDIGEPTYAFTLIDCFPILVNPQPITWSEDNFHRLTVNFTYTKWIREGKDRYNSEDGNFTDGQNLTGWF